ncbi:MAG: leucine-rich repeat domain-containing protein [Odoribacter sp.]|nr:leucine-rich repeat domain-containing protein [Odoribacter sp.]
MKKILCLFLSSAVAVTASALDVGEWITYDGMGFMITSMADKEVEFMHYEGSSTTLEIPSTWTVPEGYGEASGEVFTVTSVGPFDGHSVNPKIVIVPATVKTIKSGTFSYGGLEEVTFLGNVETLDREALAYSTVSKITFNGYVANVGAGCFSYSRNLPSTFEFPAGLKSIDCTAFTQSGITKITLPQSLETVTVPEGYPSQEKMDVTFRDVEEITFNVDNLEDWCSTPIKGYMVGDRQRVNILYRERPITSLTVPMGVEKLKPYAFASVALGNVSLPDGLKEIGAGAFMNTGITSITLPEGTTVIGDEAFAYNGDLASINWPASLTSIGASAFQSDKALSTLIAGPALEEIGAKAFLDCTDLENVTLTAVKKIGDEAFSNCPRIKELTFPDCLEEIGAGAFGFTNLTELKFGPSLRKIGDLAFYNFPPTQWDWDSEEYSNKGASVTFSEGLEEIGREAFSGFALRELRLPSTLKTVGHSAFNGALFTSVDIPAAMTSIGSGMFVGCYRLTTVNFHDNVEEIGDEAFMYDANITSVALPASLKKIGSKSFMGTGVVNAYILDAVTSIGANAFGSTNSGEPGPLRYMKLGSGITSLPNPVAESCDVVEMASSTAPVLGTERLGFTPKLVIVPAGALANYQANNRWKDYNIAEVNGKIASVYVSTPGTLATEIRLQSSLMPAQVTNLIVEGELNNDDFAIIRSNMTSCYDIDLSRVTNTTLPEAVFAGKTIMLNLTLPTGLTSIPAGAFKDCAVMHLAGIPEGVTSIGKEAFSGCVSMDNDLVIPAAVTSIADEAFAGCTSLASVDMSACGTLELGNSVFNGCNSLATVKMPATATMIPEYMFANSGVSAIELPVSVKNISECAFSGTASLKNIVLPEGLETIGAWAFSGSGLTSLSVPGSVKEIGEAAFERSAIVYANFDNGLESLPASVLGNCPALLVVNLPATLKNVGEASLNSAGLSAINSPSVEPAATQGAPFASVDNMTCALSIPKPSFSKYLLAEFWGSFVGIRNCIDVTIPEGTDVTYMDEEDYQELLEDMEQEEQEPEVEPAVNTRAHAMRVMRKAGSVNIRRGYGKLFNGASLFRDGGSKTRFFLEIDPSVTEYTVTFNGRDVTNSIDKSNNSLLIDGITADSQLVITSKGFHGIHDIEAIDLAAPMTVYNLQGVQVATSIENLPAGMYIVNQAGTTRKITVK